MQWIRRLVRRARLLARRSAVERAMDAEFLYHLECEIADHIAAGMGRDEARRTALRDFGGIEAVKEHARDARGGRALEDLARDFGYAVRVLRRNPGYTAAAVLTFALGIGAVTAIFSLVYGILLRPLPYAAPNRLVVLWERNIPRDRDRNVVSLDNYEAWRDRARGFESMAAVVPTSLTLPGGAAPERLAGAEVTPGFFSTLGAAPALGRAFLPRDAREGLALILSDRLWKRRFNGDRAIIGHAIPLSGRSYIVVGVMPPRFEPPRVGWLGEQELWVPFQATAQSRGWGRFLIVLARLGPGVSIDQARAEMTALAAHRATESAANDGWSASVVPLAQQMTEDVHASLVVLLAAVALLLVMSVANVATLTLSTLRRRARELAVRRALGATDRRLFRQLFTESALLGVIGAAAGTLVAIPGVRVLVMLLPTDIPRPGSVNVDAPVLLVTTAVAVASSVGFGCVAAVRGRRAAGAAVIGREPGDARTSSRSATGALMTLEIAVALALSVMAVLMTRSFTGLRAVDLGFVPGGVAVARVALPDSYATPADRRLFFARLVERVRALPGARAAGIISGRPLGGIGPATTVRDARRPADAGGLDPVADVRYADQGVFAAFGIPVAANVAVEPRDDSEAPRVLVSRTLARAIWGNRDPVGQTLAMELFGGVRARVAGVVRDMHLVDPRTPPRPAAFLPASRFPDGVSDVVVRVDGDPAAFASSLRAAAASIDPSVPLYAVTTLPALVDTSLARDRLTMLLLVAFATIALLLAGVGVFGVFAGHVTARRKEIGIRLALGAGAIGLVIMLLRQSLARTALGVAAGAMLAATLARGMQSLLFGVATADPPSFIAAGAAVIGLVVAATLGPALHAVHASPLTTLREE
jgi:putative ABC transport system permease protein